MYTVFDRKGVLVAVFLHYIDAQMYVGLVGHEGYEMEDEPGMERVMKGMVLSPHVRKGMDRE